MNDTISVFQEIFKSDFSDFSDFSDGAGEKTLFPVEQ